MLSKTHTKYIQTLHHKKFRDENGVFIAEGPKVVMDLLEGGNFVCKEIFATGEWLEEQPLPEKKFKDIVIATVQQFELEKLSALQSPNHVIAVFEMQSTVVKYSCMGKLTLLLDTIQDPGNLGTIIRIADWFGITGIICSPGCADQYNPKVVQSSMGSLGRVHLLYTDPVEFLQKKKMIHSYAAVLDGRSVQEVKKITEGIIVIGNESRGVHDSLLQLVNKKITIPKKGRAESLNAAVATGILLSHFC